MDPKAEPVAQRPSGGPLAAPTLSAVLRAWSATWRVHRHNWGPIQAARAEGPGILAFWHGEQVAMIGTHRHDGFAGMASLSPDGELLARCIAHLGYLPLRGSASRGGKKAFEEALSAMQRGLSPALAVDGPRGPRHQPHVGAAALAAVTGRPIIWCLTHARPALRLRSWDRFEIPLPGARVDLHYGLFPAPEDPGDRQEVEAARQSLGELMRARWSSLHGEPAAMPRRPLGRDPEVRPGRIRSDAHDRVSVDLQAEFQAQARRGRIVCLGVLRRHDGQAPSHLGGDLDDIVEDGVGAEAEVVFALGEAAGDLRIDEQDGVLVQMGLQKHSGLRLGGCQPTSVSATVGVMPAAQTPWWTTRAALMAAIDPAFAGEIDRLAEDQVDLLEAVLHLQPTDRVLDVGCGGGRHAILLQERGFATTGLDLAPEILDVARGSWQRRHGGEEGPTWIQGDMRDPQLKGQFDVAISMDAAFGVFEEDTEHLAVLGALAERMVTGGRIVLEVPNPYYWAHHQHTRHYPPGSLAADAHLVRTYRFDAERGRVEDHMTVFRGGEEPATLPVQSMRAWAPTELCALVGAAGFRDIRILGTDGWRVPIRPRPLDPAESVFMWAVARL